MLPFETIFSSPEQLLGAAIVLLVAQAVYVLFGFGSGMIAIGALALVLPDVTDVIVLIMLVNLPSELVVVSTQRAKIRWRGVGLLTLGVAVGVPIGTAILAVSQPTALLPLLGGFLVLVGLAFLALGDRHLDRVPSWVAPPMGMLSGILGGLFGTSGPPLIIYFQVQGVSKQTFRGNLMAVFLLIALLRMATYAVGGLITGPRVLSALVVLPAVVVGAFIGHRGQLELSDATFRKLVSGVLAVIGVVLLLR